MTKEEMNLNDWEITLNGQTVVYSDSIDEWNMLLLNVWRRTINVT